MHNLQARSKAPAVGLPSPIDPGEDLEGRSRLVPWRAVLRNRWLIAGCTVTVFALALILTWLAIPVYEGSTTIRVEEKEPNLPEVFRNLSGSESRLGAEVEELRSRALAAEVVSQLSLQLTVMEPRVRHRSDLLKDIRVADSVSPGRYALIQRTPGKFTLLNESSSWQVGDFDPNDHVEFGGFSFTLAGKAAQYQKIRFAIADKTEVAGIIAQEISASQANRDVGVIKVSYRSPDQELAYQVPEALVTRYILRRQDLQTAETRSTIAFLKQQISTLADQLAESERGLKSYREQNNVVNPEAEATGEVGRMVSMETQRGMLENERGALASVLAEADAEAAAHKPGGASPYRRLLAFPTLLQTQAATGLLQSLTNAEDQRKELLTRRTEQDADVKASDERIAQLERELRAMAATYLEGVTLRARALDGEIAGLQRQMRGIPERELQFARLEREPKVLEGIYTMLQTRLKEAEVAAAAHDPSVRILDEAVLPIRPVSPRRKLNAMAGLLCGLLLGVGAAFARESLNRSVRSRTDVRESTGLPVIGLIPRIPRTASPVALIAELSRRSLSRVAPAAQAAPGATTRARPTVRTNYTFFQEDPTPGAVPTDGAGIEAVPMVAALPPSRFSLSMSRETDAIAEAYRILQTNIAFSDPDVSAKTLVFTSPLPGDGKTTTVVNFALSLAQRGPRVLLIDGDVRRGVVHSVFGGAREPGLTEVLQGLRSFESTRRSISVGEGGNLDFLPTGKIRRDTQGLITSDAMRELLALASRQYDLVIVDTPPVNIITDAAVLGSRVDGVVLVARVGVTEPAALSYAVEQLRNARARMLGVVLNDIDPEHDSVYDSSYKYFQEYEYSARES